ncbi:unnamed protein product, partial [Mesorhabditis spiculigera]
MAPHDSDTEDRKRDRGTRDRVSYGGGDSERRPFKRLYSSSRPSEDMPKRYRYEPDPNELLSVQAFASSENLTLDAAELPEKYADYKDEYYKKQYKQFFDAHKNEEWLQNKYHPLNLAARETKRRDEIARRLYAYNKLKERGHLENLSLNPENARNIVRLLNAVVVLLDGGDEEKMERALKMEICAGAVRDLINVGVELPEEADKVPEHSLLTRRGGVMIRCIPPEATDAEISEALQRYPGFECLHVFPAYPEGGWMRKAMAVFRDNVDLRELCVGINGIRVKGSNLVAYLHAGSSQRVRISNPLINHKSVALSLLHKAVKILAVLDKRAGQYIDEAGEQNQHEITKDIAIRVDYVSTSTNPLIVKARGILPGDLDDDPSLTHPDRVPDSADVIFKRDERVLNMLDEIAFYMRVVYSFNLLNYEMFTEEETLPNKCEVFHIRGQDIKAVDDDKLPMFKKGELRAFENELEQKLGPFYTARLVPDTQLAALGLLDLESAAEEFIQANTVQLSEGKWLCPLSGKKFKGLEFIRKHITSKHMDAVEASKAEGAFFNNYLRDADRPWINVSKPAPDRRSYEPREPRYPVRERFEREEHPPSAKRTFPGKRQPYVYKDLDAVDDNVATIF